ncbi:palmitoyltransferase [Elysia marginata]|uniref:Palmitoyltransferase n=1 Tax=Elysia marginata TaxID=1093978 RepID=A0AAV4FXX1_9GAST|nr:palmitoyltransferase [Elysia marginata]
MSLHLPQNLNDAALFALFWLGGVFTLVYECYFILWSYHSEWNATVVSLYVLAFYLAGIIYFCMYKIISTDVSFKGHEDNVAVESESSEGWKYCQVCQINSPPRSHHCKICDECILKRDHHCWYAGYCIGYQNHRYFVCLVLHCSIAGLFANVYNWEYVMAVKGGFTWTTLPSLIAPQVGLVFGQYSTFEFVMTCVTSAGTLFTIFFISLLVIQFTQIINGQVQYEKKKGITDYSLGFKNNIAEVFGLVGLWALLCPFVTSPLPGDGKRFCSGGDKLR